MLHRSSSFSERDAAYAITQSKSSFRTEFSWHCRGCLLSAYGTYALIFPFDFTVARALEYLHLMGIVHRDIKMANILVSNLSSLELKVRLLPGFPQLSFARQTSKLPDVSRWIGVLDDSPCACAR